MSQEDIIVMKKFLSEGKWRKLKQLLDKRTLSIFVPVDKYTKWSADIKILLSNPRVNKEILDLPSAE
jgi:hypothetical protein